MLEKIKGIMTVREEMDHLKEEVSQLTSHITKLGDLMHHETVRLRELHNTQSELISSFLSATQSLNRLKDDIRKELDEFRMLNRQAQSKILDTFEQELRNTLTLNTKTLELDKTKYERARTDIEKSSELLSSLNAELSKLFTILKSIKTQDFALTEHHKKLLEEDQHKLQLMARIDELEHMLAKMKQGRRKAGP